MPKIIFASASEAIITSTTDMKHQRYLLPAMLLSLGSFPALAQTEFMSKEKPDNLFTFGARIGVNASNITVSDKVFDIWNKNSFGTGFNAGVVLDLNIRDYLAIQPGFFFESRSTNYAYSTSLSGNSGPATEYSQMGHMRNYFFQVPVVASMRFNLSDDIRWNVDFGPNFQFKLGSDDDKINVVRQVAGDMPALEQAKMRFFDFGLKLGTGLTLKDHYYIGVAYTAGLMNAWDTYEMGGKNKAWTFLIGYDF